MGTDIQTKKESIQATIEIGEQELLDIAITAVEGGIGYWSMIEGYDYKNPNKIGILHPTEKGEFSSTTLTVQTVLKGIKQILSGNVKVSNSIRQSILLAIVSDDMGEIDAGVADCIVQAGLFLDIVYG